MLYTNAPNNPWHHTIVARTVSTWVADDCTAIVQLANTGDEGVKLPANSFVGDIFPVSTIELTRKSTVSSIALETAHQMTSARDELKSALSRAFHNTTFTRS